MNQYKKILLADDHTVTRVGLEMLISDCFPHFEITHASNFTEIFKSVNQNIFDLIILDATFPEGNCISILPDIFKIQKEVKILMFSALDESIFASKYTNMGASGFISKLATEEEILKAVKSILYQGTYVKTSQNESKVENIFPNKYTDLKPNFSEKEYEIMNLMGKGLGNAQIKNILNLKPKRISLSTYNDLIVVDLKNIIRCETSDSYTTFFFSDGKKTMVSKSLKYYDDVLTEEMFFRVHQSHKVNILYIKKFLKSGNLILSDDTVIPVSQRNKDGFLNWYLSFEKISLSD